MTIKNKSFSEVLEEFKDEHDLHTVFDDFLTLILCPLIPDCRAAEEKGYLRFNETADKYPSQKAYSRFAAAFKLLVLEVSARSLFFQCTDVLGRYYESLDVNNELPQYWEECMIAAYQLNKRITDEQKKKTAALLVVPECFSGRMLLAIHLVVSNDFYFQGASTDHVHAKMTILNLYLIGVQKAEIVWHTDTDGFKLSYAIIPGSREVVCTTDPERSDVWKKLTKKQTT